MPFTNKVSNYQLYEPVVNMFNNNKFYDQLPEEIKEIGNIKIFMKCLFHSNILKISTYTSINC